MRKIKILYALAVRTCNSYPQATLFLNKGNQIQSDIKF